LPFVFKIVELVFKVSFLSNLSTISICKTRNWLTIVFSFFYSSTFLLIAQNETCSYTIRGKVIDEETKELIPFVTVRVSGTEKYTYTDENGYFSIEGLCSENNTLIISCLGYNETTTDHHHEHGTTPHIQLSQEVTSLEEVTITTEKKEKEGTATIAW